MMLKYIILLAVCIAAFETVGVSAATIPLSDQTIPELIAVLNDPVKQRLESWTVYELIRLLGKTKGNMAIEALVDNIGYPDCLKPVPPDRKELEHRRVGGIAGAHTEFPGTVVEQFPVAIALSEAGEPCVPDVLKKLSSTDSYVEARACLAVLVELFGRRRVAQMLDEKIQNAASAQAVAHLEKWITALPRVLTRDEAYHGKDSSVANLPIAGKTASPAYKFGPSEAGLRLGIALNKSTAASGRRVILYTAISSISRNKLYIKDTLPNIDFGISIKDSKDADVPLTEKGKDLHDEPEDWWGLSPKYIVQGYMMEYLLFPDELYDLSAPGVYKITLTRKVSDPGKKRIIELKSAPVTLTVVKKADVLNAAPMP